MRGGADVILLATRPPPERPLPRGSGLEEAAAARREARDVETNESRREGGVGTHAVARALEACLPSSGDPTSTRTRTSSSSKYDVTGDSRGTWSDALGVMASALKDLGSLRTPLVASTKPLDVRSDVVQICHPTSAVGSRKAVCIGINYTGHAAASNTDETRRLGTQYRLRKREDDVMFLLKTIESLGFDEKDGARVLVDDGHETGQPTKRNIQRSIKWLTKNAQAGDSLLFHFSGRCGLLVEELNESTKKQPKEKKPIHSFDPDAPALLPLDFHESGCITRDELYECLVKPLPRGVKLTVITDSPNDFGCGALDLPFRFSTDDEENAQQTIGKTRAPEPLRDVTHAALSVADFFEAGTTQTQQNNSGVTAVKRNGGEGKDSREGLDDLNRKHEPTCCVVS